MEGKNDEWRVTDHVLEYQIKYSDRPTVDDAKEAVCADDAFIKCNDPEGVYGPECVIWSMVGGRVIHVRCSYPPDAQLISFYWPDLQPHKWTDDYKRRA